jgi:hypothetical protein
VSTSQMVARHLPFLRRYARALTGNQSSGDAYVAAVLEALLEIDAGRAFVNVRETDDAEPERRRITIGAANDVPSQRATADAISLPAVRNSPPA